MKRCAEVNKNDEKRQKLWQQPSMSRSDTTPSNSGPSSHHTDSEQRKQPEQNLNKDQLGAEQQSLPSTSAQSFPYYGYGGSEYFNVDSNQNPFLMPYPRNCMWSDNMFGVTRSDNSMQMNPSTMSFSRNEEQAPNTCASTQEVQVNQRETTQDDSHETNVRSPSPVVPFSKEEYQRVLEGMGDTLTLRPVLQTLTKWLKRGDCTKTNTNDFFTLIHTAHRQVWRLMLEKTTLKENLNETEREVSAKMSTISSQYEEICKVIEVTKKQKVWDQFTKAQRKRLSVWFIEAEKLKDELSIKLDDEVEDLEDDNASNYPDSSTDLEEAAEKEELQKLREEMDTLRNQLKAVQEENTSIKSEEQIMTAMHQNAIAGFVRLCSTLEEELVELRKLKDESVLSNGVSENGEKNQDKPRQISNHQSSLTRNSPENSEADSNNVNLGSHEIRVIALIGNFLNVHPFGASVDYICSYLMNIVNMPNVDSVYVESLMKQLPEVFREERRGIGATLSKVWVFLGFSTTG